MYTHLYSVSADDPWWSDDAALRLGLLRQGSQWLRLGSRELRLDEDAYLILNPGQPCLALSGDGRPAQPFGLRITPAWLAENGLAQTVAAEPFVQSLRPLADRVGQRLRSLAQHAEGGASDAGGLDEQLRRLLNEAVEREAELRRDAERLPCAKPATRHELQQRVWLAADFIHSHYDEPLTLARIAAAARLSPFHLQRLFQQLFGMTPHACLQRKRVAVAARLLAQTAQDLSEIAERAGFGSRGSLYRHLQRELGASGQALRGRAVFHRKPPNECRTSA